MIKRFSSNMIGLIGVTACLVSAVLDLSSIWLRGFNERSPLGLLLGALATQFTPPPSLLRAGSERENFMFVAYLLATVLLYLAFAVLFWWRTKPLQRSARLDNVLLAAQVVLALAYANNLYFLIAAELACVLPWRRALAWLGAQMALTVLADILAWWFAQSNTSDYWLHVHMLDHLRIISWQALAFGVGSMAAAEQRRRLDLGVAHAELQATQLLLADTVRSSERLRIARDLHDIVGHQLTALNLHLDLAARQAGAAAPSALQTAHGLGQGLLAEVRAVVDAERGRQHIDLRQALAALCAGVPAPRVTLAMAAELQIDSAALAHTLFCCAQEAISNAVRHAQAQALTIEVLREGDTILVHIRDDGRGAGPAAEGNGLRGMRERLALLGGDLVAADLPQRGFGLALRVPALAGLA